MKSALATVGTLLGAIALSACGSKTDANEKNFGMAINQYLDKKGDLCLSLGKWPVDITEMDQMMKKSFSTGKAGQMEALEAVGLVQGSELDIEGTGTNGRAKGSMLKVKRYMLTDAAKPFGKQRENEYIGLNGKVKETLTDLCWGKKALEKVVKWDGPMKFGEYQEANVRYLYKIDKLADWANKPAFLTAFPYVGQIAEAAGKKEQTHGVKLTNLGWEAKGLD